MEDLCDNMLGTYPIGFVPQIGHITKHFMDQVKIQNVLMGAHKRKRHLLIHLLLKLQNN